MCCGLILDNYKNLDAMFSPDKYLQLSESSEVNLIIIRHLHC